MITAVLLKTGKNLSVFVPIPTSIFPFLFLLVLPSSGDSDEADDFEDEEEGEQTWRGKRRRGDEEDHKITREKQRKLKWDNEDDGEKGGQIKKKRLQKGKKNDMWRRLKWTEDEEQKLEKMGRGKRREIMSQQRHKRLAQMLKKQRPLMDEEESSETDSSMEEDRPIRKRLNRIDSDDDEEEGEGRQKSRKSLLLARRPDNKSDSDTQEKDRGCSLSSSNGHWTSKVPVRSGARSPTEAGDSAGSRRQSVLSSPFKPKEENKDESQTNILNSVQSILPT